MIWYPLLQGFGNPQLMSYIPLQMYPLYPQNPYNACVGLNLPYTFKPLKIILFCGKNTMDPMDPSLGSPMNGSTQASFNCHLALRHARANAAEACRAGMPVMRSINVASPQGTTNPGRIYREFVFRTLQTADQPEFLVIIFDHTYDSQYDNEVYK